MADDWFICEHCGAKLPLDANVCPHCGASDDSGWTGGNGSEGDFGEEDEFDYDDYVRREFPDQADPAWDPRRTVRWVVVVLLCAALLYLVWSGHSLW